MSQLLQDAHDRAARDVARWLREYARSELHGQKPSAISSAVAVICNNLASFCESRIGKLNASLAAAEQRVIAAAREGRQRQIRDALAALDAAQAAVDNARRQETVKRLANPG